MRVGLSWDLERWDDAPSAWAAISEEIEQADKMGFDSVWMSEGRERAADCSSPALFLTFAAKRTRSVQLRICGRRVTRANPVRVAEEMAVLDTFSRGRAGIAFASGGAQGAEPDHVHEVVTFVSEAWASDELRYRGEHLRFPAHTPDAAPAGASRPDVRDSYTPQWEWGATQPDFLAVTPKPYVVRPPLYVDVSDDDTLDWAARCGVSPMLGPDLATDEAVARLARYRERAASAGLVSREVEVVLERRLRFDGPGDESRLGGSPDELVVAIRALRARCGLSHFVWRRDESVPMDLYRFASAVQTLLQA